MPNGSLNTVVELYPAELKILEMTDANSLPQLGWEKTFDWSQYIGQPSSRSVSLS